MGCCCAKASLLADWHFAVEGTPEQCLDILSTAEDWLRIIPGGKNLQKTDATSFSIDTDITIHIYDVKRNLDARAKIGDLGGPALSYAVKASLKGGSKEDCKMIMHVNYDFTPAGEGATVRRQVVGFEQVGLWIVPLKYIVLHTMQAENKNMVELMKAVSIKQREN